MEDQDIIDLYFARSESAIKETESKYGKYCFAIAFRVLQSEEDSKECVNDTYLKAWNSIPPNRPQKLRSFLGVIIRNLALNRRRMSETQKRGGGQVEASLDELLDCMPAAESAEEVALQERQKEKLSRALNSFLKELPLQKRKVFLQRYWYFSSVQEIASDLGISESKVKTTLYRIRKDLKAYLEKEGFMS